MKVLFRVSVLCGELSALSQVPTRSSFDSNELGMGSTHLVNGNWTDDKCVPMFVTVGFGAYAVNTIANCCCAATILNSKQPMPLCKVLACRAIGCSR